MILAAAAPMSSTCKAELQDFENGLTQQVLVAFAERLKVFGNVEAESHKLPIVA